MASSLDRIFAKSAYFKADEEDEDTCSGSETETVPEEEVMDSGESDDDYEPSAKRARSGGVAPAPNVQKIERNPTRRPNPKVVNRNAVMARENRLRKKQHVENLEREIARLKEQRERDQKALRKTGKQVRKLTRERDHLKAVIANKSGIMAVLRAVREGSGLPMTSSSLIRSDVPPKTPAGGSSCDEGFGASPNPAASEDNDLGLGVEDADLFGGDHHLLPADELLSSMVEHQQRAAKPSSTDTRSEKMVVSAASTATASSSSEQGGAIKLLWAVLRGELASVQISSYHMEAGVVSETCSQRLKFRSLKNVSNQFRLVMQQHPTRMQFDPTEWP